MSGTHQVFEAHKFNGMSYPPSDSYDGAGDYLNTRRRSLQPSPGSQQGRVELPALHGSTHSNQEIASYSLGYGSPGSIDTSANYYPTGTPSPGHYGSTLPYQQGRSPVYQHVQGAIPNHYPSGQSARDMYSQRGVDAQWVGHPGAEFNQPTSRPSQHHGGHLVYPHGPPSMTQVQSNSRGRRESAVPQRSYVPHHRQNYFDQFIAENAITFPSRSGRDGIALTDVMNENFDYLIGRDDPMFANYQGPAISLRLEWPGYKSWTKQIKTKDWRREPKPITKAKLAIEVVKKVQSFIQDNVSEPITPGCERWSVGPGFIEVKDLVLVRLVHVSKGSWQAEFRATTE